MAEFRLHQTADQVHHALKSSLVDLEKAQQSALVWFGEIMSRRLYRELGYSSVNQYATSELGFSKTRTNDFIMLCRKLEALPKVKEKVASGELGYTAARVIVPVSNAANEEAWLNLALKAPRRVLEKEVKLAKAATVDKTRGQQPLHPRQPHRPAAVVPVRVGLEMSPEQFARYEKLWEKIRRQRRAPADKVEALLEMMAVYATEKSPWGDNIKPPVQIHLHQCPTCAKTTVPTSKGDLEISPPAIARAQCDCQISVKGKRNQTPTPPATRRAALARDGHRCRRPGCGNTLFLETHHISPRARGGSNKLENLITLCSGCHQLWHDKNLTEWG